MPKFFVFFDRQDSSLIDCIWNHFCKRCNLIHYIWFIFMSLSSFHDEEIKWKEKNPYCNRRSRDVFNDISNVIFESIRSWLWSRSVIWFHDQVGTSPAFWKKNTSWWWQTLFDWTTRSRKCSCYNPLRRCISEKLPDIGSPLGVHLDARKKVGYK